MKYLEIEFIKDKETKNAVRFTAAGEISGSLYVAKGSEMADQKSITVEVLKKVPTEETTSAF